MVQISGYYPDASPINQSSLCTSTVDNTGDDGNAIWHLGKKNQSSPKWSQSRFFKYLIKVNKVILLFSLMLMIWAVIRDPTWWSWSDWQQQGFVFSDSSPVLKIVTATCRKFPFFPLFLEFVITIKNIARIITSLPVRDMKLNSKLELFKSIEQI